MDGEQTKTPKIENIQELSVSAGEDLLELRNKERFFLHSLMDHFSDRIYFKDLQSRIIYGNKAYARLFGSDDIFEIVNKTDSAFFSDHHAREALADEQEIIQTGEEKIDKEEMETWPDGRVTWCLTSKAPLRDDNGVIIGTMGVSRDITERKQTQEALSEANRQLAEANKTLQELSFKDPLTQLWNRRFLMDNLPLDIALVERAHRNVNADCLTRMAENVDILFLMIDLDHFKSVNDRYGHHAGDLVLQQVGHILSQIARNSDFVARMGGEEFLVVARQMARADAHVLAERIRATVEAHPFVIDSPTTIHCSCSLGFAVYPLQNGTGNCLDWEQIVNIADRCLYAAKYSGRNAWVGIAPDSNNLDLKPGQGPQDIIDLAQAGRLPVLSSCQTPVRWLPERSNAGG